MHMLLFLRPIADAWSFLWRQPALVRGCVWLLFMPFAAMKMMEFLPAFDRPEFMAVSVVVQLALLLLTYWGVACVLTVGRRMLQAKSGRTRTSFKAVQFQARGLVVPLFLTDLLRFCIAVLWALPLIALVIVAATFADARDVTLMTFAQIFPWIPLLAILLALPPLHFLIRTTLSPMVVAYEKTGFRPALKRSAQLIRGHLGRTIATIVLFAIILVVPSIVVGMLFDRFASGLTLLVAMPIIVAALDTLGAALWLLGFTQYYKALGGKSKVQENE